MLETFFLKILFYENCSRFWIIKTLLADCLQDGKNPYQNIKYMFDIGKKDSCLTGQWGKLKIYQVLISLKGNRGKIFS